MRFAPVYGMRIHITFNKTSTMRANNFFAVTEHSSGQKFFMKVGKVFGSPAMFRVNPSEDKASTDKDTGERIKTTAEKKADKAAIDALVASGMSLEEATAQINAPATTEKVEPELRIQLRVKGTPDFDVLDSFTLSQLEAVTSRVWTAADVSKILVGAEVIYAVSNRVKDADFYYRPTSSTPAKANRDGEFTSIDGIEPNAVNMAAYLNLPLKVRTIDSRY